MTSLEQLACLSLINMYQGYDKFLAETYLNQSEMTSSNLLYKIDHTINFNFKYDFISIFDNWKVPKHVSDQLLSFKKQII